MSKLMIYIIFGTVIVVYIGITASYVQTMLRKIP